jgi:hypothetical protein
VQAEGRDIDAIATTIYLRCHQPITVADVVAAATVGKYRRDVVSKSFIAESASVADMLLEEHVLVRSSHRPP